MRLAVVVLAALALALAAYGLRAGRSAEAPRRLLPEAVAWVRAGRPPRGARALELLRASLEDPPLPRAERGQSFLEVYGCASALCLSELEDEAEAICLRGFGARVPIFDYDTEPYRIWPESTSGLLALDLDGTTVCDAKTVRDASDAMCRYRSYGVAVVVITARPAPLGLPPLFERCVQAVFYNSSGRDVPAVKARQLLRAREALAPRAPRGSCVLLDDRPENVLAAGSAGCRGILARCHEVDWGLLIPPPR